MTTTKTQAVQNLSRNVLEAISTMLSEEVSLTRRALGAFGAQNDDEALHDVRVSSRRLVVWLKMCERQKISSHLGKPRKFLSSLIKATNTTRDLEVRLALFNQRIKINPRAKTSVVSQIKAKWETKLNKRKAQIAAKVPKIVEMSDTALSTLIQDLAKSKLKQKHPETLRDFIAPVIIEIAAQLDGMLGDIRSVNDEKKSHQARLVAKSFRYLLEPIALELPSGARVVKNLRRLQDLLGGLRDDLMLFEKLQKISERPDLEPRDRTLIEGALKSNQTEVTLMFDELQNKYLDLKRQSFESQTRALFSEPGLPATR